MLSYSECGHYMITCTIEVQGISMIHRPILQIGPSSVQVRKSNHRSSMGDLSHFSFVPLCVI